MKKSLKIFLLIFALYIVFPVSVFASGSIKPNKSSLNITKGSSATFTINASNATGRVDITSNNTAVATASVSSKWMDNDSLTVTVNGISNGTAVITVKLSDAATYDEEELTGSYTVSVNVSEASSSGGNSVGNFEGTSGGSTTTKQTVKNDATLSKLEIAGYSIDFNKNTTEYSIDVNNDVVSLDVKATPNNSTSKASISGNNDFKVGENLIVITVTSEDGTTKKYLIKVNRKDEIPETSLDNILTTLKNTTKDTIAIKIDDNYIISNDVIQTISNSGKNVIINKYSENRLLYSWTIENKNIGDLAEFNSELSFDSENIKDILKLTNYSEMFNLNFKYSGDLPDGTKIKICVEDKFANGEKVNLYFYNSADGEMKLITKEMEVVEGYVEFELEHCSEYILTRATLVEVVDKTSNTNNTILIISIVEAVIIVLLVLCFVFKEKVLNIFNKKEDKKHEK